MIACCNVFGSRAMQRTLQQCGYCVKYIIALGSRSNGGRENRQAFGNPTLPPFGATDDENNSCGKGGASSERRNRNSLFPLGGCFDWTDIEDLFRLRVSEAFKRQHEDTKDNQEDADDHDWFHTWHFARSGPK